MLCFLKKEFTARRNFQTPPPRLWLKLWVRFPVAASGEGDASHPRRPGKAVPSDTLGLRGAARFIGKERPARRATCALSGVRTARPRGVHPARPCGVQPARSRGVQPARLAACNRHVLRRATGTSCGVQPARLAACNRHVLRRATGTSLRRAICAVRCTQMRARARDLERVITALRLPVRLRARFAISRSFSFLNLSVSDSGF